jgi:FKBP-type peptidyl-prolyl cis-trans isomerase
VGVLVVVLFFFVNNLFAVGTPSVPLSTEEPAKLLVQDERIGTGAVASAGDLVSVNYIGRLQNGTVFDSSAGKDPYEFVIGAGEVIPGWEQGIQGMKVGGKRLLIIPPQLAYGARAFGPIPANATLIFEVQLVKVGPPPSLQVAPEGAEAQ